MVELTFHKQLAWSPFRISLTRWKFGHLLYLLRSLPLLSGILSKYQIRLRGSSISAPFFVSLEVTQVYLVLLVGKSVSLSIERQPHDLRELQNQACKQLEREI